MKFEYVAQLTGKAVIFLLSTRYYYSKLERSTKTWLEILLFGRKSCEGFGQKLVVFAIQHAAQTNFEVVPKDKVVKLSVLHIMSEYR